MNTEQRKEYNRNRARKWRETNKQRYQELTKIGNDKKKGDVNHKWRQMLANAAKKDREVTITLKLFQQIITSKCYLCGTEATKEVLLGVDRVDNKKGYSEDNCKPCCKTCNAMKEQHTLDVFLQHIQKIATYVNTYPPSGKNFQSLLRMN